MRVIKIDRHRVTTRALAEVKRVLRSGGVVAFPTETAYGLAADPRDPVAVRKVFAIKARPAGKPLPFVAASPADVARVFSFSGETRRLGRRHWPGPLSIVLSVRPGAKLAALGRDGTGAVRVPASAWARAVALAAGGLATSTSANVSGEEAIHDARSLHAAFRGRSRKPDLILDAGRLPKRPPSTIIRLHRGKMEVLRQGAIKVMK